MFRHLQQVQNAKESRLARQFRSNIRKPDRFNRIDFNRTFLHAVSRAHSNAGTHPDSHAASDFPAPYSLAKPPSEHHEDSLRPTVQPAQFAKRRPTLNGSLIAAQPHRRGEKYCCDDEADPQPRTAQKCSCRDMCHGPRREHIVRGVKRWRGSNQSRPHQGSEMPGSKHDEFNAANGDQRQRSP